MFVKGKSGNPSGRPKDVHGITELARSYCPEMVKTLHTIANNPKTPPAARVAAASALLDRGLGKPAQTMHANVALEQLQGIDAPPQSQESREEWLARRRRELETVMTAATTASAASEATKH